MLVVVPATGVSAEFTDPFCPARPDSGSCKAWAACEDAPPAPAWAPARPAMIDMANTAVRPSNLIRVEKFNFVIIDFSRSLFLILAGSK
jgi:hypothetical protein